LRRPSEKESPWPTVAVDSGLERAEQLRHELDFVEHHVASESGEEAHGVAGGGQRRRVVEREVPRRMGGAGNREREGALDALARSGDERHRAVLRSWRGER